MFRNQYDSDVTTWSPQGRIHQIEYAMEAVKQGSATVGIKSRDFAVLVALKRAANELSSHQKKIFTIDEHVGVSIAGLLSDARLMARFMQSECLQFRFVHQGPEPMSELMESIALKLQINTQRYGRRPFGVGLLVASYDEKGPHIIQTCPSGNVTECKAMAIGARSQSARTYLDKHLAEFQDASLEELIRHCLISLRDTLPNELNLSVRNTSVAVVGKGRKFEVLAASEIQPYLDAIETAPRAPPPQPEAEQPRGPDDQPPPDQGPQVAIESMEHSGAD